MPTASRRALIVGGLLATCVSGGCHASHILNVPPPEGQVTYSAIDNDTAAEGAFYAARSTLFGALGSDAVNDFSSGGQGIFSYEGPAIGLIELSGWLTDEFVYGDFLGAPTDADIDARQTTAQAGFRETGDLTLQWTLTARSELMVDLPPLEKYETGAGRARIGEAFALVGYVELLLAEDYCAGAPLSQFVAGGGVSYAPSVSTDSLFAIAVSHFDSALVYASTNDTITALANVGLGRALLDRGQYAAAATAVSSVPTNFVYNVIGAPDPNESYLMTFYESPFVSGAFQTSCASFNVADREGTNGLNFRSAADPRLMLDPTQGETCDVVSGGADSVLYYPVKFGNPALDIPLATGVEARLIAAEADLQTSPTAWAADLNALRADSADTHVTFPAAQAVIPADSTTGASSTAQVDLMFRERAFWLFGTGTRLGDLRRLIRQYGRANESVFPTGPYMPGADPVLSQNFPAPLPNYGTDVNLTLPTANGSVTTGNPYYHGCLASTKVA